MMEKMVDKHRTSKLVTLCAVVVFVIVWGLLSMTILFGEKAEAAAKLNGTVFYAPLNNFYPNVFSSGFGPRSVSGGSSWHAATDYGRDMGTPIYPIYTGQVVNKGYYGGSETSYSSGHFITIRHDVSGRTIYSHYQHMNSASQYNIGDIVIPDNIIGYVGHTGDENYNGNKMGCHLDIRIFEGGTNPWKLLSSSDVVSTTGSYESAKTKSGITYYNPAKVLDGTIQFGGNTSDPAPTVDSWTYRVVTSDGLNMRSYASTSGSLVTTLFSPTTVTVTQKTTSGGYTWGYGTSSTGYTGWIVVDNGWTTLVSSTVDSSAPSISNVQVYDVSSSGYTVSCSVTDNVGVTKVAFPTWTTNNGQDDLFSNWPNTALGTISNGTATYRVNTSSHNNETGCTYITHIYAYDAAGNTCSVNQSTFGALQVDVPTPTISTTGIQLDKSIVNVDLGSIGEKSFSLNATIYPTNATNKTVHWWSDDQSIARVDDNGLVTPVSTGTTVITAMAENGGYQATCTVNISTWINGISLNTTEAVLNLADHETLQLTKTITPNVATNKNVAWASTDPSVATVSSNGLVTPVGTGVAVITCTAQDPGGFFALCAVTVVNDIDVETIALSQSRIVFDHPNDSGSMMSASFTPTNATRTNLTWMSSDETVATVSDGIVQPLHEGYAKITCTAESGATAVCEVIVHAENIIHIPSALKVIKARSFLGSAIKEVVIPNRTTLIESKAYANCDNLRLVIIPASVTNIASDAFSESDNVVFICESDSTAAEYATSKGIIAVLSSMPESVNIFTDTTTVVRGRQLWLGAEVIPDGVSQRVTWSIVEGEEIASIDQTGMLTTQGVGVVTVAATAINGASSIMNITILDKPTIYSVMFDPNGGTCDTAGINAIYDAEIGFLPVPDREFYSFDGWYTEQTGGSLVTEDTVYSDYDSNTLTLYAHWKRITYNVVFEPNGGTCETTSKYINCGDAIGTLPIPVRVYYTFDGWYTTEFGGSKVMESATFTADTSLYAHWSLNGFGSWSAWSTIAVTGNDNRQVETKTEQEQTGTKKTYNYNRFLYYRPDYGYYMASYGSNWATSNGYSGSWQYLSSSSRLPVDHQTDGQNVYLGEVRDGNKWWYNESESTEPIYSNVTYYRYRDRIR